MSWYTQWFGDAMYMELYSHRDAEEARGAVNLFLDVTGLHPDGTAILDLACGTGRHAFEFARRGFDVTAADLSEKLLAVANRKTRKYQERVSLLRCDMRRLPFRTSFAAVAQLFTAFGYFPTDEENEVVIEEVAGALLSGGWYMLDFFNSDHVRRSLVERTEDWFGGNFVRQQRWIEDGRVEKRISIREGESERMYAESVRLFTRPELEVMLARHGFAVRAVLGSYDGTPFHASSSRCILFSVRL